MSFSKAAALDLLRRAHAKRRLAHAYLISGPQGSGKRRLALELSALANGLPPDDRSIESHPDVHIAEPESKSRRIVIDQIRSLEKELQMRSLLGGRKIGLIIDADRLQIQASNAFLKTLEEPPENSLLLLTTAIPEALPETIISRCIPVALRATEAEQKSMLQRQLLRGLCDFFSAKIAGVSETLRLVRRFMELLQQARQEIQDENAAEFSAEEKAYKQATDGRWLEEREAQFKALTEARYLQQRTELLETVLQWWADVLRQQQGFAQLDLPEHSDDTARIAQQMPPIEALKRVSALEQLREHLERNVQELLAIEAAFLKVFTSWNAAYNTGDSPTGR